MLKVKICGVQRPAEALTAGAAGADFIGLVFVPRRRRRLERAAAAEIAAGLRSGLAHPPRLVGLFADQPLAEVNRTIADHRLELAQLCGQESPDYCRQVMEKTGAAVIKVAHVAAPESSGGPVGNPDTERLAARLRPYQEAGCRITLDRLVEGLPGGTGQTFDWTVAAGLARQGCSFLLAGGLTPDNVAQAVTLVGPWGVDVSSGVETGGVKDPAKIRAFIQYARAAVPQSEA